MIEMIVNTMMLVCENVEYLCDEGYTFVFCTLSFVKLQMLERILS